jgi:hypothetical protein
VILVQALLTLIVHSLGRVLNMVFGWATVMLFGRVPQERQIFLSIVAFGSILWFVAALGIVFPSTATVLLAFVPVPRWVEEGWIRIAMLAAAVFVPPLVGESAIRAVDPERQPRGAKRIAGALISGYRFAFGIAVALVTLMLVAPILWTRNFRRGWVTRHVPVIVHRRHYATVLDAIQGALNTEGVPAKRGEIGGFLRIPTAVLAFAAAGRIQALDAETARLSSNHLEILLYPFDLVISGQRAQVSRAQAIAADRLPRTKAYMTWSEQGNTLEDRLKRLWAQVERELPDDVPGARETAGAAGEVMAELEAVGREMRLAGLTYEEWEVLFREVLMVERDLLRRLMRQPQGTWAVPKPGAGGFAASATGESRV